MKDRARHGYGQPQTRVGRHTAGPFEAINDGARWHSNQHASTRLNLHERLNRLGLTGGFGQATGFKHERHPRTGDRRAVWGIEARQAGSTLIVDGTRVHSFPIKLAVPDFRTPTRTCCYTSETDVRHQRQFAAGNTPLWGLAKGRTTSPGWTIGPHGQQRSQSRREHHALFRGAGVADLDDDPNANSGMGCLPPPHAPPPRWAAGWRAYSGVL